MPTKTPQTHLPVDRLALLLLAGIILVPAWSIFKADWMPSLDVLTTTAIVSLLLGTLISTRAWRGRVAHVVMILYGIIWITWLTLDFMPDKIYGMTWLDTLRAVIIRLGEHIYIWLEAVLNGGVGKDNTIFLMFLVTIFWLMPYIAVWNTFRQQHIWRTVAPAGIVLLINTYYYGGPESLFLLVVLSLFFVLLYAARMYTLSQAERWHFSRVRFDPEIKRDFLQIGSSIALLAVVFGAIAPTVLGAPQITDLWREVSRPLRSVEESFNRLFSGLQPHGISFANPFGRTLALLGQRTLGTELVMEVNSPEGHYWQAVIYDVYDGNGWQTSETNRVVVDPNGPAYIGDFKEREWITQTVTTYFPNNTLIFAAPQPIGSDHSVWVDAYPDSPDKDFAMWTAIAPMNSGDYYRVISAKSTASIAELRAAGASYPSFIRDHYLQLPTSVPLRVRELARQIAGDAKATTPYDEASALETWLRTNVAYNEKIPAPPPNQDGVDYVLFTTKEGYCDYYASAMAIMARALGIPARIATGYTPGVYDSNRHAYEVYQSNAHTWVEIYFPKYGWIEFEPTASQPTVDRPATNTTGAPDQSKSASSADATPVGPRPRPERAPEDIDTPVGGSATSAGRPSSTLMMLIVIAVALTVFALVTLGVIWVYENRGGLRQLRGSEWAFARMARMAQWLRVRLSLSQTPYEQAHVLSTVMPRAAEPAIDRITNLYVLERYSPIKPDPIEARSVWRDLRGSMWLTGLKRRLPRPWRSVRKLLRW
jgi:transglutaminase-like putative cysteine protease